MNEKKRCYLGNQNIKRFGVSQQYTKEELNEYIKCANDPIHFINTYYKMVTLDSGLRQIQLWDYQKEIINTINQNRFTIVKAPRQSSKTSSIGAFLLHHALFNTDKTILIFANKADTSREILNKIVIGLENLPFFLQPGVNSFNKGSIDFDNGSRILTFATTSTSARSYSGSLVYLDEFAWVDNDIEFYMSVYPVISSGETSKVVISSTPNGLNLFYKIWNDAKHHNNDFIPIEINWWNVPGRDTEWKEKTIKNTSERQFNQEFECKFLGSSGTLIPAEVLERLTYQELSPNQGMYFYQSPQHHHKYMIVSDVSRGVGKDYSVISVIDITQKPYQHVCIFRDNMITPIQLAATINDLAILYYMAYVLIENNDLGQQTLDELNLSHEYENIIFIDRNIGVKTTKKLKTLGCIRLKDLLVNQQFITFDYHTIRELGTFVEKNGSYRADKETDHDDIVMTLVIFAWFEKSKYFEYYIDDSQQTLVHDEPVSIQSSYYEDHPDSIEILNGIY